MEEKHIIDKSRKIIPAGTRKITKDIFKNHDYSKQEALALPHSVEEIESDAFKNWKELSELIFFCNITDKIHMEGWLWNNQTQNQQCRFIVKSKKIQKIVQKLGHIDSTAITLIL